MICKVKCIKPVSLGLFSIDSESLWGLEGIRYSEKTKESMVRLNEITEDGNKSPVWVEVPQKIIAESFDLL